MVGRARGFVFTIPNQYDDDHNEYNVYMVAVGNIPFEVTESELREKFEQAGPIVNFR